MKRTSPLLVIIVMLTSFMLHGCCKEKVHTVAEKITKEDVRRALQEA